MKKLLLSLLIFVAGTALAQTNWYVDKYSMFVHYGLYSIPGGVFDGKPVERGYSEQILTFGIGFSDWYEAYAREFDAREFDANAIVALAKAGGMRSVVMTSKHHDGFCLFDTQTTDYNVMNTPAKRDLLGELAEACHREGIGFGVYFSLIDWHYPYAVPFSSHNADQPTPPHHEYNMAQVRELLTQYGRVDELWFDMGSLTKEQSAELYALVHELQPQCMVSGRLGNDYADFCVMADNEYPDYQMAMPWQTAASMFDETWGYRSWQERGKVEDKVEEKLASLIKVVALGGKYLLNIGPKGDGSIVGFESEVIRRIGEEIEPIKEAIYNTLPVPSRAMSTISSDRKTLYTFVKKGEKAPHGGKLLGENTYYEVYAQPYREVREKALAGRLTPLNATPLYAHSSADYYASFRSIIGYEWSVSNRRTFTLEYTDAEVGKTILVNGKEVVLQPTETRSIVSKEIAPRVEGQAPQRGRFGTVSDSPEWEEPKGDLSLGVSLDLGFSQGMLYRVIVPKAQSDEVLYDFEYTDAILVYLNGTYIDGAIHREAGTGRLQLLLPLKGGDNELLVKVYNRWGRDAYLRVNRPESHKVHEQKITIQGDKLTILKPQVAPLASPAHLSNLRLR